MKCLYVVTLALAGALTQIAQAQVLIIPPSVTSVAPGRQFLPGPTVTSLGPRGLRDVPVLLGNRHAFNHARFSGGRRGLRSGDGAIYVPYPVAVPAYQMYAEPDVPMSSSGVAEPAPTYQPDPNYAAGYGLHAPNQVRTGTSIHSEQLRADATPAMNTSSKPVQAQPSTLLVFKDGHKLEVTNYVIQGTTLFNLSDKGPRKISLADLDVPATVSENDNRGVEFQLP